MAPMKTSIIGSTSDRIRCHAGLDLLVEEVGDRCPA